MSRNDKDNRLETIVNSEIIQDFSENTKKVMTPVLEMIAELPRRIVDENYSSLELDDLGQTTWSKDPKDAGKDRTIQYY